MSEEQKIIFPTLPMSGAKEVVPHEIHLTDAPSSIGESADIVRLDAPVRLTLPQDKDEGAYRTIGEIAEFLGLPAHVIRFWQTRFHQIKPMTRDDGRRYYRPKDVRFLRGLSCLLHKEGYTIKGVHRLIRKEGSDFVRDKSEEKIERFDDRLDQVLYSLLGELEQLQARVKKLVA